MRRLILAAVLLPLAAPAAHARPLMETPTPTPAASPAATPAPVEPAPSATRTPEASPSPEAFSSPSPSSTPAATATPAATEAPVATPVPVESPLAPAVATTAGAVATTPPPAPIDWAAGMPGSAPGPHPLRAFMVMGFHVFTGQGWDRKNLPVGQKPIRSADYVGGMLGLGAIYDIAPTFALVATAGGHNGQHTDDTGVGTTSNTISYNAWWADTALRAQTPADLIGLWVQMGPGIAVSRRTVTTKFSGNASLRSTLRTDATFHLSTGMSFHLAQGLEVFGEMRWMTAQGHFAGDPRLDMGGLLFEAGGSLRL
ncbi:MAG TPA: hypothetical protein VMV18_15550 [bacterium]|nr:hypothetical protein [bacterium]